MSTQNINIEYIQCRCCLNFSRQIFAGKLMYTHKVQYYECGTCGYVQTEDPYWIGEAYARSITRSDTGIMYRNQTNAKMVLATLAILGNIRCKVVDYAGGYGILVRLLRDFGIDASWMDRYSENLLAPGFEYIDGDAILVTAFEAFEHFVNPEKELLAMLTIAPNVLLSTEIMPNLTPHLDNWWYYGKEHGQHIGFFRVKTLEKLANRHGKFVVTDGKSYHLITSKSIDLRVWKIVRKLISMLPWLVTRKLDSKVWSDHLLNSTH